MGIKEIRDQYGNKKCRQLINHAIRNEIPGGGVCIDLLHDLRSIRKMYRKKID